jgi:hypothetical protein
MKQRAIPIISSALLLGVLFNWFFVERLPGLSVFIYAAAILTLTLALAWQFRAKLNKTVYWIIPAVLFFAGMVFVRANQFLAFINILTITYLLSLIARLAHNPGKQLREFEVSDYISMPPKAANSFITAFNGFFRTVTKRTENTRTASYVPIIRGVLYALPILVVFLLLLSSADLVFNKYATSIFHPNISPEFFWRTVLIVIITSVFIGAFAYIFRTSELKEQQGTAGTRRTFGVTESSIILGSVAGLFLIFVAIQSAYLFGGSSHILSTGYTYAQYARKGFFELIAVAAISLLLVGAIKKSTVFRSVQQKLMFKWLSGVLVAEVLIIMVSAHKRLDLYEDAYGFTTLRLLSHLFILWLAYALGQLLYHIIRDKRDSSYAFQVFVSLLCFMALINLVNPDNFIARRNIERYNATGKIDTYYLRDLSEDATPALADLLDSKDKQVQKDVANMLYWQKLRADQEPGDWLSTNLGRQRAKDVVNSKLTRINTLKQEN